MKKPLVVVLVVLAAASVLTQVVVSVARAINGREARQQAEAWLQEAQQDAKPEMMCRSRITSFLAVARSAPEVFSRSR